MTALAAPAPAQLALFDYEQLDVETRIVVRERATQARDKARHLANLVRQTAETVWAFGEALAEVQARLAPEGFWLAWCDAELPGISRGAIYNAINVYRAFPQLPTVGNGEALDVPLRALYLLAAPSTPEEARVEVIERIGAGETITAAHTQEIVAKHKPAPAKPEPILEDEPLTPHEQQIAARIQDEQARALAEDDAMSDDELSAAAAPPEPPAPVAGEVIATAPAAASVLTPLAAAPALTPLMPAASPADATALKTAEALVALLEQALTLAQVERDRLQRELPDAHFIFPDEPVESAARMFLLSPAVKGAAGFLAMSAREGS